MSIFITNLAFAGELLVINASTMAILLASFIVSELDENKRGGERFPRRLLNEWEGEVFAL